MIETTTAKQARILETAKDLFIKHGIKRVSVEEICRKAGVSKMTFYRYYANKNELAKAAILWINEENLKIYRDLMAQDIPFSAKMEEIVRLKLEGMKDISEALIEDVMHNLDPEIAALFQAESARIMEEMVRDFVHAQQQGWIRADIQPGLILFMLGKINDLFFDPHLNQLYPDKGERTQEILRFLFYGLGVQH